MFSNRASAPEATPLRRLPNFWILGGVTYILVLAVAMGSMWAYRHYWPNGDASERALEGRSASITVGSVWVPVYPGAIHHEMTSSTNADVTEGDLAFTSGDAPEKLIAFYRERLRKANLRVTLTKTDTGGVVQAVGNRAKTIATITISAAGSGSTVQVHTRAVETKS
jgi:hypothetical protein